MISRDTPVGRLLDEHPELLEVLASYHSHFTMLRNKVLRRIMAPRVTLAQAARIAGVPTDDLLSVLRRAVGEISLHQDSRPSRSSDAGEPPTPSAETEPYRRFTDVPEARRVHLDVREDIRRGQEPFARIMAAAKALADDQVLVVRAPFEPVPLYDVLGRRGLGHWTERHAADDWSVSFARDATVTAQTRTEPAGTGHLTVLDVRGLEPPEPMVRVLHAIDRLGAGDALEVHHNRRPTFLYPQLDERGFVHETDEPESGLVRIRIRRRGP